MKETTVPFLQLKVHELTNQKMSFVPFFSEEKWARSALTRLLKVFTAPDMPILAAQP